MADNKKAFELFRMAVVLTLVCAVVAVLISSVYAVTEQTYQQNLLESKRVAIATLFDDESVTYTTVASNEGQVKEVFRVMRGENTLGYCANVSASGFGGAMDMMVAVASDGTMLGVDIVTMSETPGLGSRVGEEPHLSQYAALGRVERDVVLGEDIDAISGATISSRAVNNGVNAACRVLARFVGEVTQ